MPSNLHHPLSSFSNATNRSSHLRRAKPENAARFRHVRPDVVTLALALALGLLLSPEQALCQPKDSFTGPGEWLLATVARACLGTPPDSLQSVVIVRTLAQVADSLTAILPLDPGVERQRLLSLLAINKSETMLALTLLKSRIGIPVRNADSLLAQLAALRISLESHGTPGRSLSARASELIRAAGTLMTMAAQDIDEGQASAVKNGNTNQQQANSNSGVLVQAGPNASVQIQLPQARDVLTPAAHYRIAWKLAYGDGRRDSAQAWQHAAQAADSGYAPALTLLGQLTYGTLRWAPNRDEALRLWKAAANKGDSEGALYVAQVELGETEEWDETRFLEEGHGYKVDADYGREFLSRSVDGLYMLIVAAQMGNAEAKKQLKARSFRDVTVEALRREYPQAWESLSKLRSPK